MAEPRSTQSQLKHRINYINIYKLNFLVYSYGYSRLDDKSSNLTSDFYLYKIVLCFLYLFLTIK